MKNCKKLNVSFGARIFGIALVIMLTATALWAKPKNVVEYTPFKSENPNATVFECEDTIQSDTGSIYLLYFPDVDYEVSTAFEKETKFSSLVLYGWKKKKGGWENLGKYQLTEIHNGNGKRLAYDRNKYTHYAVEAEVPENSLTFSAKNGYGDMVLDLHISKDYEKTFYEKRAAEEAEKKRLEAEEKAKLNAEIDAMAAKEIAKGYVYHGTAEAERNAKLFAGGALQEGHAYYVSGFVVKYGGTMAAIEYADGFFFSSQSTPVYVDYIDQKLKGEIVDASLKSLFGKTIEIPLTVVVVGGKAPLHKPVVIGIIE